MTQAKFIFILGRYPDLSKKEIEAVLEREGVTFEPLYECSEYFIVATNSLPVEQIRNTLGGTIKIGKIFEEFSKPFTLTQINNYLSSDQLFIKYFDNVTEKINFGLSSYANNTNRPQISLKHIADIAHHLKDHLDAQGFHSRFPRQNELALSSVSVEKNKLLINGAEILIIETENKILLGKTLWVQDFEGFSKRDYGRPLRDMESGIMPPKIARMMLNIAKVGLDEAILDPFCGSGTILQEAILLGFVDITGTDLSKKAVHDTNANLAWLQKAQKTTTTSNVFQADIVTLSQVTDKRFKAIITEPYMGPNIQERRSIQAIQLVQEELLALYKNAWKEFYNLLRPEGVVTMILPAFLIQKKLRFIDILAFINELGFEQITLSKTERGSIVIGNTHDFVLREVVQYRKK